LRRFNEQGEVSSVLEAYAEEQGKVDDLGPFIEELAPPRRC
jgi:hypothetical protein